jgi:hypothetical protein
MRVGISAAWGHCTTLDSPVSRPFQPLLGFEVETIEGLGTPSLLQRSPCGPPAQGVRARAAVIAAAGIAGAWCPPIGGRSW